MSTTCKIGILKNNGKVDCIICWRDGSPDTAGETLAAYYDTTEKVDALIAGGHLFDLDTTIEKCRYQKADKRIPAEKCKPITYGSRTAFFRADHGQRFTYIYQDGRWCIQEEK